MAASPGGEWRSKLGPRSFRARPRGLPVPSFPGTFRRTSISICLLRCAPPPPAPNGMSCIAVSKCQISSAIVPIRVNRRQQVSRSTSDRRYPQVSTSVQGIRELHLNSCPPAKAGAFLLSILTRPCAVRCCRATQRCSRPCSTTPTLRCVSEWTILMCAAICASKSCFLQVPPAPCAGATLHRVRLWPVWTSPRGFRTAQAGCQHWPLSSVGWCWGIALAHHSLLCWLRCRFRVGIVCWCVCVRARACACVCELLVSCVRLASRQLYAGVCQG